MKRLVLLIRHAHAAFAPAGSSDHDRPLTAKGVTQAAALSVWLNGECGVRISRVVASSASRAVATAEAIAMPLEGSADNPAVTRERLLYNSSLDTYLSVIAASPPSVDALAVVAHNPTISDTATWLTGGSIRLPPAAAAVIEVQLENWTDITVAAGRGAVCDLRLE